MEIKKYLKSITERFKDVDVLSERNFRRDWRIVSITGFVIILGALMVIWYFSVRASNNLNEVQASDRAVLTINRSAIDEIVNFYKNQDKLFVETKNAKAIVPDPSN